MFSKSWIGERSLLTGFGDDETEHRSETIPTVPGLCEVLGPTGLLRYRQISYGHDFGIKSALTQKSSPQG